MLAQLAVAVQEHRRVLGSVAVLVHVCGDAGHALDREVEGPRNQAQAPHERQDDATDTGVYVEEDSSLACGRGHLFDRVDGAVREVGRRSDAEYGVGAQRGAERIHVRAEACVLDRRHDHAQPQILRGLVEGRMRADRQHHLGVDHRGAVGSGVIARRLDREHDALGAAARHVAHDLIVAPKQPGQRPNHVLLHAAGARVHVDVEGVLGEKARVGLGGELVGLGGELVGRPARVVQAREDATAAPVHVLLPQLRELIEHALLRAPVGSHRPQFRLLRLGHDCHL